MTAYNPKSDPRFDRRAIASNLPCEPPEACSYETVRPVIERLEVHLKNFKEVLRVPHSEVDAVQQGEVAARKVRQILKARRKRDGFFGHDLFADPAWDILLELFAAEAAQQKTSVSKACIAAAVPATTGLRWLVKLERAGLIIRSADNLDGRRHWVTLSPQASVAMWRYLASVSSDGLPI